MQVVMGEDPVTSQVAFVLTTIGSAIPGAGFGAWIADHYGGYKEKNLQTALRICCFFALLVTPFAAGLTYLPSTRYFIPGLWCTLFLGACIVPTCYGIMVSSVAREL